ncbi:alpha/beta hydrolase [Sporolactobacillus shoreicorticis]|uniref:Alpha/beta hydrolase family protein n=1 Tax=Sporolactobacillus shoreicorticis TaxID=1923877 RepID=A0ABW5S7K7_9BACL|nr:alpha/beta hydrolase [Sporolactobacillus shoreicorticis]MCO7126916.1 alpha/beta hydrolase [Sporolactobacillus shoreicorticis]
MTVGSPVHLAYGDAQSQFGVLRVPKLTGRCPVVVTIHGGFWKSKYGLEEVDPLDEDLVQRGYATWNIEYRRVGEDGGGWTGTFHDVVDAVNHLNKLVERYPLDIFRVIILGHSAGGHLALWLASRLGKTEADEMGNVLQIPIKGVLSLAGVSDLQKMWESDIKKGISSPVASFMGGTPHEVPERYCFASPYELLPMHIKQVLVHGELDCDVPVELSVNYHRKAIEWGDRAGLIVCPEADHFKIIDPSSSAWRSVADSLETLLRR